ncbi:MAG: acyl-CoA desaturase [Bacteroidales bacterium]|jgi:linoleoyl-CoA desaturase|nr:acyl-CoA desaturase [Bacteroidales bacterium]
MEQKRIRFSANNKNEFIIELREKVKAYFKMKGIEEQGNLNLIFKTIFMLSLYFTPYILLLSGVFSSFTGVLICWILMGIGQAGVGMGVMHDANHRSFSKNQKINKLMSNTLYLLGGSPLTWQHQHNTLHHGFTNIEGHDEDISPVGVLRFSPHKPLKKIHRYQHFYAWFFYGLMTILWVTTKDFKQLIRYDKSGVTLSNNKSFKQIMGDVIISKVIYYIVLMMVPMLILPFAWYWIVMFFLVMHFTSGFILTIIFQTAHVVPTSKYPVPDENGTIENNWAVHQLYTTSDYSPKNRVFSWFIGGLNYQVEHHLFPNISHVHYRKLSKLVKEMADKYNLPYHVQPGFFKALREHTLMLKKLGRVYAIE